ncbi:hypothetical protein LCGC14_1366300 [marine sediment metagenome]|uniref:Uncharacterized protein n=1 Tax=marine sediment metagenome TaxID=412755 RepID=A0A0F9KSN5_9ZZZZ
MEMNFTKVNELPLETRRALLEIFGYPEDWFKPEMVLFYLYKNWELLDLEE